MTRIEFWIKAITSGVVYGATYSAIYYFFPPRETSWLTIGLIVLWASFFTSLGWRKAAVKKIEVEQWSDLGYTTDGAGFRTLFVRSDEGTSEHVHHNGIHERCERCGPL